MDKKHQRDKVLKYFKGRQNRQHNYEHRFMNFEQHLKYHADFHRMHRSMRFFHPIAFIFILAILFMLFNLAGLRTIVIIIAILLVGKELLQILFYLRLEKRIFRPIEALRKGVEQITGGNYDIKIDGNVRNEIGLLIASFNEMAVKLAEGEKIKAEYENNRKALFANISHDLKTPITSIQGYIEAILDNKDMPDENKTRYMQIIHNNVIYVNKLIDDLFLFARLDMQKLSFNFEKVSVKDFMRDMAEEFSIELDEKRVKFCYSDEVKDDLYVLVNGKRIHQVLNNIIGNSLRYGPEDGLVIKCTLREQDGLACINITDNGPGIAADRLPYIFDRFYRINNNRTKDPISTGLGLSIARELMEAHGGNIKVESNEGEGASFTISLPPAGEKGKDIK